MKVKIGDDRLVIVLAAIFIVFLCISAGMMIMLILRSFPETAGLRLQGAAEKQAPARSTFGKPYRVWLPMVLNQNDQSFSFITWADTKSGTVQLEQLSNQAASFNPVFTLFAGDLEENGFTSEGMAEWVKAVDGGQANGMAAITFPVRGNHDLLDPEGWQNYFSLQEQAQNLELAHFSSLDSDLTYTFDYANAHFIGLDVAGSAETITERQVAFLDQDLNAAEARNVTHTFLFFHGPIYPIGAHSPCTERVCPLSPQTASLVEVINRHPSVSAVFNGHEHLLSYVHLDASRIPDLSHPFEQFISGAAGAELHPCNLLSRFDTCDSTPGFVVVEVNGRFYSVVYYQQGSSDPLHEFNFVKE